MPPRRLRADPGDTSCSAVGPLQLLCGRIAEEFSTVNSAPCADCSGSQINAFGCLFLLVQIAACGRKFPVCWSREFGRKLLGQRRNFRA